MIPEWCHQGNLVYVDECEDELSEDRIGLILDYYVVDVDQLEKDDYDDLIYHEEWLLLDISTDLGVLQAVHSYNISPVVLAVKIGENNAET